MIFRYIIFRSLKYEFTDKLFKFLNKKSYRQITACLIDNLCVAVLDCYFK